MSDYLISRLLGIGGESAVLQPWASAIHQLLSSHDLLLEIVQTDSARLQSWTEFGSNNGVPNTVWADSWGNPSRTEADEKFKAANLLERDGFAVGVARAKHGGVRIAIFDSRWRGHCRYDDMLDNPILFYHLNYVVEHLEANSIGDLLDQLPNSFEFVTNPALVKTFMFFANENYWQPGKAGSLPAKNEVLQAIDFCNGNLPTHFSGLYQWLFEQKVVNSRRKLWRSRFRRREVPDFFWEEEVSKFYEGDVTWFMEHLQTAGYRNSEIAEICIADASMRLHGSHLVLRRG